MGSKTSKTWRDIPGKDFKEAARILKEDIKKHRDTQYNIAIVGESGAGKSAFINSVFSVYSRDIRSVENTSPDTVQKTRTKNYLKVWAQCEGFLHDIYVFFTDGVSNYSGEGDKGITQEVKEVVCEGQVPTGLEHNKVSTVEEDIKKLRPHCIIFVVSAGKMEHLCKGERVNIHKIVPEDSAKIVVLTKVDMVCDGTNNDIQYIYSSDKVKALVKIVQDVYGVQENEVFPMVNLVKEVDVETNKTVPLLHAIKFALNFAEERKKYRNGLFISSLKLEHHRDLLTPKGDDVLVTAYTLNGFIQLNGKVLTPQQYVKETSEKGSCETESSGYIQVPKNLEGLTHAQLENGKPDEDCLYISYAQKPYKLQSYDTDIQRSVKGDSAQVMIEILSENQWRQLTYSFLLQRDQEGQMKAGNLNWKESDGQVTLNGNILTREKNMQPEQGRSLPYVAPTSSDEKECMPSQNAERKEKKFEILDSLLCNNMIKELKQHKKIKLIPVGNCKDLREEIERRFPPNTFVSEGEYPIVVGCIKTSRIQCDAETAIQQAMIGPDKKKNIILLMFHLVAGSVTAADIENVMYVEPSVLKTLHVPFQKK